MMRTSWDFHRIVIGNSGENPEKGLRKSWESPEKAVRKSWESHEKVMRKS